MWASRPLITLHKQQKANLMTEFIIVDGLSVKVSAVVPIIPYGNVSYEITMQAQLEPSQNELTAARGLTEIIESIIIARVRDMSSPTAAKWLEAFTTPTRFTIDDVKEAFDQELS